jgi:hypothetical protein
MNVIIYFGEIIAFLGVTCWFILLPGFILLMLLRIKLSKIETFTLSVITGAVAVTLLYITFGFLKLHQLAYVVVSAINILFIFSRYKPIAKFLYVFSVPINRINTISFFVITICTTLSGILLFRSGWQDRGGISVTEYRDAFWHLGLMRELVRSIPPTHPGFAVQPLSNYHYFTHALGAFYLSIPVFNYLDFYFRIFPFFLTFLFCLSTFITGRILTKSIIGANLSVLFSILSGSLAFILPFFVKRSDFVWHESSFWLSQPFSMIINPSFALSSSMLIVILFVFYKLTEEKNRKYDLLIILLSGTLIGFKVYAGLLILGGMLVSGFWYLYKEKNFHLIKLFTYSLIISFIIFLPANGRDAGKFLVFMPGWFLRSMVESSDRVPVIDWILRENTYMAHGNIIGVLKYRFYEFIIYFLGNLGIRIFGIIVVADMLRRLKKIKTGLFFITSIALVSFAIPLFYVQDGSIANTLQFSYYGLEIASLIFVVWLTDLIRGKTIWLKSLLVISFVFLAIPTSIKTLDDYVVSPSTMNIPIEVVQGLSILNKSSNTNDIILVPATSQYTNSLFIGTLSNRRLFYSDRLMAENTHKDFKLRESLVSRFYASSDKNWNANFLADYKIRYIYLDRGSVKNFNPKNYPIEIIYREKDIEIYKTL